MNEQVFLPDEAQRVVRDYVCAQCWGPLVQRYDWRLRVSEVECPRCGAERGLVTRRYAERRREENRLEWVEARANLAGALGITHAGMDSKDNEKEILKKLGFGGDNGH